MIKTIASILIALATPAIAQSPSSATLTLSLKTMSKALAGCRVSYTRTEPGKPSPLLKTVIGAKDYDKDLQVLGMAERFTNFLIAHPNQVRGRILVAMVSTSDDFSAGVGSTPLELLRALTKPTSDS